MDPGRVVWLPGSGYCETCACQEAYGSDYYACDDAPWQGGIEVLCCN